VSKAILLCDPDLGQAVRALYSLSSSPFSSRLTAKTPALSSVSILPFS
jgi:hypothetical protein